MTKNAQGWNTLKVNEEDMSNSGISVSDFFCGAGGSSWGMKQAGLDVLFAANHDSVCIDTHAANLPEADHACVDIQASDPRRFPRTDMAWLSPECTNHSEAKVKKTRGNGLYETDLFGERLIDPAEERSRMTMYEAFRYAETHMPKIVIIENVPAIRKWHRFPAFLREMEALGYYYRELILNSRFFGVAQSRERYYGVFWRKGHPAPDLNFTPPANCERCGTVSSIQTWKPGAKGHQYGQSYFYRCPVCNARVEPFHIPCATILDWSLPAPLVGERKRPLKPKTRQRILAGLKKFSNRPFVLNNSQTSRKPLLYDTEQLLPTITTLESLYLANPPAFILDNVNARNARVYGTDQPMPTIKTHPSTFLTIPPASFIGTYHGGRTALSSPEDVLPTIDTSNRHALTILPFLMTINHSTIRNRAVDQELPTVMPQANPALVLPASFILEFRNAPEHATQELSEALSTITQVNHHALIMVYYGAAPAYIDPDTEPLTTITTKHRHALVLPEIDWEGMIDECRYRLLTPQELKLGQSLPAEYILLGSKAKQISMIGNAVSSNVAQALAERCIATFQ